MPARIADIELWSSWPIGRCWRDGLNKLLVGHSGSTENIEFAARSSTENISSGGAEHYKMFDAQYQQQKAHFAKAG